MLPVDPLLVQALACDQWREQFQDPILALHWHKSIIIEKNSRALQNKASRTIRVGCDSVGVDSVRYEQLL